MKHSTHSPAEVFPPGEFIKDELEERGWLQADFADILGVDKRTVSDIVAGKRSITPDMAVRIGAAFGTSPNVWLNLDNAYQLALANRGSRRNDSVPRKAELYTKHPIRDMVKRGWISDTKDIDSLEKQLADFVSPRTLAARRSDDEAKLPLQLAWLDRAYQMARRISASPFSKTALAAAFESLRAMRADEAAIGQIPDILNQAGVRFLLVQHLPNSKIDGACFWLSDAEPVVALSLRYDRIDYFWFTLMHELYHVQCGHGRGEAELDVDIGNESSAAPDEDEVRVNRAAFEFLVPPAELETFLASAPSFISASRITRFAADVAVHPGIVVGQLHYRKAIPYDSHRKMLVKVLDHLKEHACFDGWGVVA